MESKIFIRIRFYFYFLKLHNSLFYKKIYIYICVFLAYYQFVRPLLYKEWNLELRENKYHWNIGKTFE